MTTQERLALLRGQYATLIADAKKLMGDNPGEEGMPAEVSAQVEAKLGKSDEVKAEIDLLSRLSAGEGQLEDPVAPPSAASMNWRNAAPAEGDAEVDAKAWRSIEIDAMQIHPVLGLPMQFKQQVRFNVPLAVQIPGYSSAFEAYMHMGVQKMGGQDYKTLSEGVDSAGGFLVPEDYQTELIRKIATMATIRSRARVAQTSRDIAKWPKLQWATDDKYTSGVRFTWTGETPASSTTHRATDPAFGLYSIPVHTAMASLPLTNDLIEDSAFDVLGVSMDLLAEAFTLGENNVFLNGTGVSQPMGLLTQIDGDGPASVHSGDASLLLPAGLVSLWGGLPAQYESGATWIFNKATEVLIRQFRGDGGGGAGTGSFMWPVVDAVGEFGPAPRELLGFPLLRDEFMPDVAANAFPILFGDLRSYLILDRVGLAVQRLSELYAETNITLLLARKRVGGQCIEPWRIKAQKVAA